MWSHARERMVGIAVCTVLQVASCSKGSDPVWDIKAPPGKTIAPGALVVNEMYLKVGPPPENTFAGDGKSSIIDPDQDGAFLDCDKFIELVNTTDEDIDLAGVQVIAGKDVEPKHTFESEQLGPRQAVVLFYGYGACAKIAAPSLGDGVVTLRTDGKKYGFAPATGPQIILKDTKGASIDSIAYGLTKDTQPKDGISLVRSPESSKGGTPGVVLHDKAPCVMTVKPDVKTLALAYSPGRCVSGAAFDKGCPCTAVPEPVPDQTADAVQDLVAESPSDQGEGPVEAADPAPSEPKAVEPILPGALVITEVQPFPDKHDANQDGYTDKCDKFVEVVALEEADLDGVELVIDGQQKADFTAKKVALGKFEGLVVFSKGTDCTLTKGLPFKAVMADKSMYQELTTAPESPVKIELWNTSDKSVIDSFSYHAKMVDTWTGLCAATPKWDEVKAAGYSLVRKSALDPGSPVIPHPFSSCFKDTPSCGLGCKSFACAVSPGLCPCDQSFEKCPSGGGEMSWLIIAAVLMAATSSCGHDPPGDRAICRKVRDGDTFEVEFADRNISDRYSSLIGKQGWIPVRLLGVDYPDIDGSRDLHACNAGSTGDFCKDWQQAWEEAHGTSHLDMARIESCYHQGIAAIEGMLLTARSGWWRTQVSPTWSRNGC